MNWSRCSKALTAALLVLAFAMAPVAAVSTSTDGVPQEAQAGAEVTATYTFTELYTDYDSWTLRGSTNLTDVTWTVTKYGLNGDRISRESYDGATFDAGVDTADDVAEVRVRVRGTAPDVEEFTYDPAETFTFATFDLVREGGTNDDITSDSVHHYTAASKESREAIESAQAAIEDGGGSEAAERALANAIEAYNNEEFGSATTFANEAKQQADQAQSTQNRNQLLVYAAGALLALGVVVGGVFYWRSQQDSYDKLG